MAGTRHTFDLFEPPPGSSRAPDLDNLAAPPPGYRAPSRSPDPLDDPETLSEAPAASEPASEEPNPTPFPAPPALEAPVEDNLGC